MLRRVYRLSAGGTEVFSGGWKDCLKVLELHFQYFATYIYIYRTSSELLSGKLS